MNSTQDNSLRILFISSDKFPPFRVDVSVLFGKEIVGRGHKIDWLLQSDKAVHRGYQSHLYGGKVWVGRTMDTTSHMASRAKNHWYATMHDFRVFELLKTRKYDCIIVRDKFISALLALVASKLRRVKLVYWLSYPFPEASIYRVKEGTASYPLLYWIRGHIFAFLLYRILLPFSDHVFVQTIEMLNNIAQKRISRDKMTAVPMAVSINEVKFFGHTVQQREKKEKNVVYLGTLMKSRKMDFLVRSFEGVLKKEGNARLYMVGGSENASDEQFLKSEAKRLQIDYAVTITGFLPQKEAWQYVKDADVCVSPIYPAPIWNCGSPTKLIEYMAMGKAVVANDHPEQHLVISESKAGICVPYEEDAFSEAILYLLKNWDVAREMGMRGREYIEKKRNYEQTADLVEKKLLQLLASTPR